MPDSTGPDRLFASLARQLTRTSGVTFGSGRRGFGSDALQIDGRIFGMLRSDHLVLKLPRDRVAEIVTRGDGEPFDAGKGTPMKEWVMVRPGAGDAWLPLAKEALAFVAGRRPSAGRG